MPAQIPDPEAGNKPNAQIINPDAVNKPKQVSGIISITSNPKGCSVIIGNDYIGKTPLKIKKVAGTYNVTCEYEGYLSQSKTVKVNGGKTVKCSIILEKPQPTPKDSLLMLANEFISKTPFLPEESSLDEEGKGILTFQKDVIKYATHIKSLYVDLLETTIPSNQTDEALAALIKGNLLKILHSQELEKSCLNDALSMITNMSKKEGLAKQGFNKELVIKAMANNTSPVPDDNSNLILNLCNEAKFTEALKVTNEGLLNPKVILRYKSFLICWKNFYNVGDLRLEEIKHSSNN